MSKYKTIRPGQARAGDIAKYVNCSIDRTNRYQYLKILDEPANNGSYIAKDKYGYVFKSHLLPAVAVIRPMKG